MSRGAADLPGRGADHDAGPLVPRYDGAFLGAVLPAAAVALGLGLDESLAHGAVPGGAAARGAVPDGAAAHTAAAQVPGGGLPAPTPRGVGLPPQLLPAARAVCVVIVDGLGLLLLEDAAERAPFLSSLIPTGASLQAGCPSTTATSMGSFGTGLPPGRHGLVGYEVMDPDRGVLLNELRWDPDTDPLAWQPHPTVFDRLVADHVAVTKIGNPEFDGSGLTLAALRGGDFVGAMGLDTRVDIAVSALAGAGQRLVYLYWGALDGAGHRYGWRSPQWRRALWHVDRELARLARRLDPDTVLLVTGDHGMVDVPHADRLDLADHPDLCRGIQVLGGEARFAQAYCEPGAAEDVAARFADVLGEHAWVRTRDEAVDAGWFGIVDDRVRPRLGDVLVAAFGSFGLVDSRTAAPHALRLIGQHGSLTEAEQLIPLLVHPG